MGDFERTFGAGADADLIIEAFSALAMREQDEDEEWLSSGKDLPQAKTFYDLTGQVWHPGEARARLTAAELSVIDELAQKAADEINSHDDYHWDFQDNAPKLFLKHVGPGLVSIGPSLDAFGAFIGRVVRECHIPIVFARDTGPFAGYVSCSLSTHIIAFPDEHYLARLGGLRLEGPFSDFESYGGWVTREPESFRAFAKEGPGREILEISAELRDPSVPIVTVSDWLEAEWGDPEAAERGGTGFAAVARRVRAAQRRSRTWSDASENALRAKVRGILCALASAGEAIVFLNPSLSSPSLGHGVYSGEDTFSDLLGHILDRIDVSTFRGLGPSIELCSELSVSAHERLSGVSVLLETLAEGGIDVSAAADALARADWLALLQIVSPEAYEETCRARIRAYEEACQIAAHPAAREEALARLGLKEEDLPF